MPTLDPSVEYHHIPGHPAYMAGTDGSVWSCWMGCQGGGWRIADHPRRKLRPKIAHATERHPHQLPYRLVRLMCNRRSRHVAVHILVLEAFVGPCPPGMQARHLNGNVADNALGNLAWGTPLENHEDKVRHGTNQIGERNGRAILSAASVIEMRRLYDSGIITNKQELARRFGICRSSAGRIVRREQWTNV